MRSFIEYNVRGDAFSEEFAVFFAIDFWQKFAGVSSRALLLGTQTVRFFPRRNGDGIDH